jgi:hypothetical protein
MKAAAFACPRVSFAAALLSALPGCNSGGATPNAFPLGSYGNCAITGPFAAAGEDTVALSQAGSMLRMSEAGDGGTLAGSLEFVPVQEHYATLAGGQQLTDIPTDCGNAFQFSTMDLTSGSLGYNAGALFVSVTGTVEPVDTGFCSGPGGPNVFLLTCGDDGPVATAAASAAQHGGSSGDPFVGVYDCRAETEEFSSAVHVSASSGPGTLTVTHAGSLLAASYAGDPTVQGSLDLAPMNDALAVAPASPNDAIEVSCFVPAPAGPPQSMMGRLPISSGAMTTDGRSAVLTVRGISSDCGGDELVVFLRCTPRAAGGVDAAAADGEASTGD